MCLRGSVLGVPDSTRALEMQENPGWPALFVVQKEVSLLCCHFSSRSRFETVVIVVGNCRSSFTIVTIVMIVIVVLPNKFPLSAQRVSRKATARYPQTIGQNLSRPHARRTQNAQHNKTTESHDQQPRWRRFWKNSTGKRPAGWIPFNHHHHYQQYPMQHSPQHKQNQRTGSLQSTVCQQRTILCVGFAFQNG